MFPELSFDEIPPLPGTLPEGLSGWVAHIRDQEMPVFGSTVDGIREIMGDDSASAGRLAAVILKDPAMTTKVLRLANSAYFNSARQGVGTISRAIVVLGFDLVADLAIGVALVDGLLKGGVRKRVEAELAHCFFAAALARGIAKLRGEGRAEEVFIAALLTRVGEMAFWCFGGTKAELLADQLPEDSTPEQESSTQMVVLGFRLRQLSVQLAREWRLGSLLHAVLEPSARPSTLEASILQGHQVARAVAAGWDSPAAKSALTALARYVDRPEKEVRETVATLAHEAARLATEYGAASAARSIPASSEVAPTVETPLPMPSPAERQLAILRELTALIMSGGRFSDAVYLAAEGILQGVGFSRVVVALLTPNRLQLVGKYGLGAGGEALRKAFVLTLGHGTNDPVDTLLSTAQPVRLTHMRGRLAGVVGQGPAAIAPIMGNGRVIGVVYAERDPGAAAIDDEAFFAFVHFVQQMSMALVTANRAGGAAAP
ncbi:HDOD domain-containing protein [Denitromonas iodatirespirans]|uniref:HDOD domain-containing protein n=1 Tax=Denitromonas iodatirespirans TaxID=2795389 RepID=A0A944HC94_DENI1|nr:HDOD domain-containing protein [Denitromonas iodatirespirans]MBT0962482.1 HDOD domain-containing protein [Denitromonas iodatirespirans]